MTMDPVFARLHLPEPLLRRVVRLRGSLARCMRAHDRLEKAVDRCEYASREEDDDGRGKNGRR